MTTAILINIKTKTGHSSGKSNCINNNLFKRI